MTEEERQVLLVDCKKRLEEIETEKDQNEQAWKEHYNANYKRRFAIEDGISSVAGNFITGLVLASSAWALATTGHSMELSLTPIGGYIAIGLSGFIIAPHVNAEKRKEYNRDLEAHTSKQNSLDEESAPCRLVSNYIEQGDKYLLRIYRANLATNEDKGKDEFGHLDFDTTNLSPLMVKAIEEIRVRSAELRDELRKDILQNISFMQTQIAASTTISIPELEEVKELLKQYVPVTVDAGALTK